MKIAKRRYQTHRSNSQTVRRIPFLLIFEEWYNWWLSHGVNKETDTRPDLHMARIGDSGPYSLNNIYLATKSQNTKDSFKNGCHVVKRIDYSGNYKKVKTPYGVFESRKHAAQFLKVKPESLNYRIKTYPYDYSYID